MIKLTVLRHYYKNNVYGGMGCTIKDFDNIEQAIKYAHRYARRLRFAGLQIEDEEGRLLYEITSDFNVYDYRSMKLSNIFITMIMQK